jgi:hypothetical protein
MVKEKAFIFFVISIWLSFLGADETSLLEKILDAFQIQLSANPQSQRILEETKCTIELLGMVSFIASIISLFKNSPLTFLI